MVKGFIFFRDGKIPFVIENYRMELFTDDSLLDDFCKEYNFKENYILHGQCFDIGIRGRKATFLVENSIGSTCYLRCYTINMFDKDEEYDSIGLQSPSLDEVFRCEYEYIDMVRAGINLAIEPKVVYKVPFGMNDQKYELEFRIGHDNRLGLLEDLDRKCELILPLHTNEIQECYDITNVLHRLAMFMTSHAEVPFKRITLYKQGLKAGWFYCPLISEDIVGGHGGFFHEFARFVNDTNVSLDKNVLGVNYDGNGMVIGFYHPYECIFSDSVKRFHLKNHEDKAFVLLFMKVAILQQKSKFGYLYKFNAERMANTKIMLPVTDDGAPDYEYMEQYAKNLMLRKYKQYLSYLDSKEKTDTVATDN